MLRSSRWGQRLFLSMVGQALRLLPPRARHKLFLLVIVQLSLSLLDTLSVAVLGLMGALAVGGIQSRPAPDSVLRALEILRLDSLSPQAQVAILGALVGILYIVRTASAIGLTRRSMHFLAYRSAVAAADVFTRIIEKPMLTLQRWNSQYLLYVVSVATNAMILGLLGTLVSMAADTAMMVALGLLVLFAAPGIAIASALGLSLMVLALNRLTTQRAGQLAREGAHLDIATRELVVEAMSTLREMKVRQTSPNYIQRFTEIRERAAHVSAESAFIPSVSKYVLETGVVLGSLCVGAAAFATGDAAHAVSTMVLFLATGTRLAPAVVRLQQALVALRSQAGAAAQAREVLESADAVRIVEHEADVQTERPRFAADIAIEHVGFTYPNSSRPALSDVSVSVHPGGFLAVVGESGAGKSTLIDVLLGLVRPDTGSVTLSGREPMEALRLWPGSIAYVPQDVWIADSTIRGNITLGFNDEDFTDEQVWLALERAQLADHVRNLKQGLNHVVGERGSQLSGGQRQRLGIARALVTQPQMLVLDEATSALDATTEANLTDALLAMRGEVTLVIIAHRLSTVRAADLVLYLENSEQRSLGSFETVLREVPKFEEQAKRLGLR